jgi:NAD(P)-dependent dehydrogenase (short-subunit alcohol dehydrogenase family)
MPEADTPNPTFGSDTLAGAHALVTGGGTGIGLGIALRLAQAGACVTIAGRRAETLDEAAAQLAGGAPDAEIRTSVCDVADADAVAATVAAAADANGQLQISVANAGMGTGGPFLAMDPDVFRNLYEVNVFGAFNTLQQSGLAMREKGGSIIAISSIAGALGGRFRAAYASSKAALDMMVRSAADELGGFGIRVNSIRPGVVRSEATAMMFDHMPHMIDDYVRNMPLGWVGDPEDIGDACVWLGSQASRWVTGQNIAVDGGHTLRRAPDLESGIRARLGDDEYAALVKPGFGPNGT